MKKKLLSIFLSLSLIFSSIASMSVAFAEEPELEKIITEKVVQQDGIEVRMDMKAGSSFNIKYTMGQYKTEQYFDNGSKMKDDDYNGWQIMKIVIDIPKNKNISNIKIEPLQDEQGVPENIKKEDPSYFELKEYDNKYLYNFYFLDNGIYKFDIYYKLNGKENKITVDYEAKDLLEMDLALRIRLLQEAFPNRPKEEKYLTKTLLGNESKWFEGIIIGDNSNIKNVADKITSLNGVQYMGKNLTCLRLSWGYKNGFINLEREGLKAIASAPEDKKYENLYEFVVSEKNSTMPYIPKESYWTEESPNLIEQCVEKMPNLQVFYCEGSGFNNFKVFEGLEGNKLNDIWCGNNGVTSIEGIEKHNLNHIGIHNTTAGKNAGLPQNGVFDLTPLKNSDLGAECLAVLQEIDLRKVMENKGYKDYKVLAVKDNDKVKIELPMPIDINAALTDVTNNEVIAKYGNETIKCTANENNSKKYIEIDNTAFGGKVVEDIENIEFSFKFNNDSGNDERTKGLFNGTVRFKSTLNPIVEEKATVKYEAKNTSKNRTDVDVDDNILDVKNIKVSDYVNLPKDEKEYNVGETVTLQNPTTTKKINEDGEETGVSTEIKPGESVLVKYEVPNTKKETYVELKFEGYEPEKTNLVAGENTFVGKFKFNDLELVHYDFITDEGKEIPKNIEDKIRKEFKDFEEDELYYDGRTIALQKPSHNEIEDTNGTWKFKYWEHEEDGKYTPIKKDVIEVHHDEDLIGVWHFEPKSTGGGTGGGGTITPTPNPNPTPDKEDPDRVEGDDRIETSIEASEILYPNGTNTVVLANAERFSDVLTANPFAVQEKASALLTYKDKLPEKTLKEIERLGAKKIYVSGGYEAVSKKVVDSLAAKGYEIYRFDGLDRYDTARKIAIKIREKGNKEVVELASGENYPDALCMTSMAVKDNAPILLTKKDSIPKYTKQALAEWDIENVKIGGLDEAISKDVQNQIDKGFEITKGNKADSNVYDGAKKVSRFGGKDRYETSTIIAANSYPESKLGVYATGEDFPDALIAGNYAGRKEAPVLLVKRDTLPEVVEKYTTDSKIEKATVIGGVNAVSDKVFNLIKAAINK